VRRRIGERLLLYRLGSDDMNPTGTQIQDAQRFAAKLEESGVDILDVSGGLCGSRPEELQGRQGFFVPQAQQIKRTVDIPVIGVGGIVDPEYAERLVREERVDLVAVGRELVKDPDWAKKARRTLQS
jgi:2,4-dienoyl-CoA reductase-like NADH-dependent reductase (Old Yellow Enzyme family)